MLVEQVDDLLFGHFLGGFQLQLRLVEHPNIVDDLKPEVNRLRVDHSNRLRVGHLQALLVGGEDLVAQLVVQEVGRPFDELLDSVVQVLRLVGRLNEEREALYANAARSAHLNRVAELFFGAQTMVELLVQNGDQ